MRAYARVVREHVQHPVPARLAPYVASISGYRLSGFPPGIHVGAPSGCLTLIIDLSDGVLVSGPQLDDPTPRRFGVSIAGLHTRAVSIHHDGHQYGIQVELTPAGARALLGVPAAVLLNDVVHLDEVISIDDWRDQLGSLPSWPRRLRRLEDLLTARVTPDAPAVNEVAEGAWWLLRRSYGRLDVQTLSRRLGCSARHLSAQCRAELGIGPKAAGRLIRFERSRILLGSASTLAALAADCGYSDQAHLTREWRELIGMAPTAWLRRDVLVGHDVAGQ